MVDSEHTATDGTTRKTYYGVGKQPWDTMVERGWAAHFAAGNVIKYLRRTKPGDEAHAIESARWYYAALQKLACGQIRSPQWEMIVGAQRALDLLVEELSNEELDRLG